ncbi:hypothetical protein [Streptomyces sp. NPDC005407]|uniref:hypothetical protein n=1 Tax=Streptomyces sp. NPDC005407 TaxID=3155340 RepID=UPI0033B92ACF
MTPPDTPTAQQLRALADFIDEQAWADIDLSIGAQVAMRDQKVRLQATTETTLDGGAQEMAAAWLELFTPERTKELSRLVSRLSDRIASPAAAHLEFGRPGAEDDARWAWRTLTRVARMWPDRPGFQAAWAEPGTQDTPQGTQTGTPGITGDGDGTDAGTDTADS